MCLCLCRNQRLLYHTHPMHQLCQRRLLTRPQARLHLRHLHRHEGLSAVSKRHSHVLEMLPKKMTRKTRIQFCLMCGHNLVQELVLPCPLHPRLSRCNVHHRAGPVSHSGQPITLLWHMPLSLSHHPIQRCLAHRNQGSIPFSTIHFLHLLETSTNLHRTNHSSPSHKLLPSSLQTSLLNQQRKRRKNHGRESFALSVPENMKTRKRGILKFTLSPSL